MRAERLEPRAPLDRAVVVAHAIAGRDHVAARQANRDQVFHFSGHDRRVHFVESAKAFGHCARRHEREPLDGAAQHLQITVADRARDAESFACHRMRAIGVPILQQTQ